MKLAHDFTKEDLKKWIGKYEDWEKSTSEGVKDKLIFEKIHEESQRKGFLTKEQLYDVAKWKTKRVLKRVKGNNPNLVKKITSLALAAKDERFKICLLCCLDGIGIGRASTLLTMHSPQKYGVIDRYGWFALKGKGPKGERKLQFSLDDWEEYLGEIRALAKKHGLTPRKVDMALMKYGEEQWNGL